MARIDALIATQLGDVVRPNQTARDAQTQQSAAVRSAARPEPDLAASEPNADELRGAMQQLQKVIGTATGRSLEFALNDRFKEIVVQISDRQSGEVVKEIPSKEFMQLRERLNDLIGLFVDEKA